MRTFNLIKDFVITYIQTAPVNFLVVAVCGLLAIKLFGWTTKRVIEMVIVYFGAMFVSQIFGIRMPTYIEIFNFLKELFMKF